MGVALWAVAAALERDEDDTGDQDGQDVEESEDDADEIYDDPPSPRTPCSGENVDSWSAADCAGAP